MVTCFNISRPKGFRCLASNRPQTSPRLPGSKSRSRIVKFFGVQAARELVADGKAADLLLGNNVLAHVPDINDFVAGLKIALRPTGVHNV